MKIETNGLVIDPEQYSFSTGVNEESSVKNIQERINQRRQEMISSEAIDEEEISKIEKISEEIYRLKSELKHILDGLSDVLPQSKSISSEDGQKKISEANWEDYQLWIENGVLQNFWKDKLSQDEYGLSLAEIDDLILNRKRDIERVIIIKNEIDSLQGVFGNEDFDTTDEERKNHFISQATRLVEEKISQNHPDYQGLSLQDKEARISQFARYFSQERTRFESLTDEQKMVRVFNFFKTRELVESRIKRKEILGDLEELEQLKKAARKFKHWDNLDEYHQREDELRKRLRDEVFSSEEAYYDYFGQNLLEAQQLFSEDGKIYETPSVKAVINRILSIINEGSPVFVYGETGTGKTELVKYIARKYFQKEALVISGSRGMELSSITELQQITTPEKKSPQEQISEINRRIAEYLNSDAYKEDLDMVMGSSIVSEDEARQSLIENLKIAYNEYYKNPLETTARLQPFYQAAKEGRMVIFDEMNAIPHHTLIALNDLLTKRPLDQELFNQYQEKIIAGKDPNKVIQELNIDEAHFVIRPTYGGDPFVVAPGFCVAATGNWNPEDGKNYVGRQAIDTAFLRRFGMQHYDYLQNPTAGYLNDPKIDTETERIEKSNAELYQMLCARVINNDLSAELPEDAFDQLDNLAQVARIVQDAFSGLSIPEGFEPESITGEGGTLKASEVIHENVLDLGKLIQYVVTPWQKDGYRYPLEYYLFDRFITRSSERPAEMIWLYKCFQTKGFFHSDQGYPELVDMVKNVRTNNSTQSLDSAMLKQAQSNRIKDLLYFGQQLQTELYGEKPLRENSQPDKKLEVSEQISIRFFTPKEVINKVIGTPPKRKRYPNLSKSYLSGEDVIETESLILSPAEMERRGELSEELDTTELDINEILEKYRNEEFTEINYFVSERIKIFEDLLVKIHQLQDLIKDPSKKLINETDKDGKIIEIGIESQIEELKKTFIQTYRKDNPPV